MERKKITFDSFIRGILIAAVIVAVLALIRSLSSVLLPFFVAWLLAYLIYPLVALFQYRLRLKYRVLAIGAALLSIAAVLAVALWLLVPPMVEEMGRVRTLITSYFSASATTEGSVPHLLSNFIRQHLDAQTLVNLLSSNDPLGALREAVPGLWRLLSESVSLLASVLTFFIILLYTVFILFDYERISDGWIHLVPHRYRPFLVGLLTDVKDGMNRYFRGQALVAACVGVLFCIGFSLIDFPLAIVLGIFVGILNLVPYLQIVGFIPTIVLAILKAYDTGGNFWIILLSALAVFAVVQTIQDGLIVPRVMGRITGLTPAIILLSLSVWGSLMGMVGMIIALPLTTLMISYYRRYIIDREPLHRPTVPADQPPEADVDGGESGQIS